MDKFKAIFFEEAQNLINELERVSLLLSKTPDNVEIIEEIFRIMHTLKGNSTMFGFQLIGDYTHHLETIYDHIREGKMHVNESVLSITFASVDHLRVLLADIDLTNSENRARHEELVKDLAEIIDIEDNKGKVNVGPLELKHELSSEKKPTYFVRFNPRNTLLLKGSNPFYLIDDLISLGKSYILTYLDNIPDFDNINGSESYLCWEIYISGNITENEIRDIFMFVEDDCDLRIEKISDINLFNHLDFIPLIEENKSLKIEDRLLKVKFYDKKVLSDFAEPKSKIRAGGNTADSVKNVSERKDNTIASVRVPSEKLDELMRLVSELVTTQASLQLFSQQENSPVLLGISENIEKITRQLRDNTFSICLVPVENLLIRFQRLIRDLSKQLNKDIDFITEGADTELDKNIIENLADPLMHIFRNSLDHGIETSEERIKVGKSIKGKIFFKAYYSGNNVIIQIKDDGKGIDPDKIRSKAISKGLISQEQVLDKRQILDLIFLPGFSTAEKVTEVSGRGVGMDVVKRQITDIRGEVEIDSEVNKGTTISIKLPLTLSIIDGLLVKINTTYFIIPLTNIDKCFEASHKQLVNKANDLLVLEGQQVPTIFLREQFEIRDNCPEMHQVIVIKQDDKKVGLTVDNIIGEYQAVLKPLGKLYKNVEAVSGATILGNGEIALVIDVNGIIKEYANNYLNKEVIT